MSKEVDDWCQEQLRARDAFLTQNARDRKAMLSFAIPVLAIIALVLFAYFARGAEPTFTVTNKIPPAFTVTNKVPQAEPPPAYRLYQDASGQWWQVPATQAAPVREVRPPLPFSEATQTMTAPGKSGTAASMSGVVVSSPVARSSMPGITLTGHAPIAGRYGPTTMPRQCVGFV